MNVLDKRERPILFSAPMVLALLDGRKTQTRRVVKPQPEAFNSGHSEHGPFERFWVKGVPWSVDDFEAECCPYGQPGDRLWVKETWRPSIVHSCFDDCTCDDVRITYRADGATETFRSIYGFAAPDWSFPKAAATGNVSPLFMPRWASRITVEITDVRVQRLQDISDEDAQAEGVDRRSRNVRAMTLFGSTAEERKAIYLRACRGEFESLWTSINGLESWDEDPWVWALTFKRVEPSNA